MKFCPTCKKAVQRSYLIRDRHKSDGRFEALLKLVYRIFDDSILFALIKFSFIVYRKHEKRSQIFDM